MTTNFLFLKMKYLSLIIIVAIVIIYYLETRRKPEKFESAPQEIQVSEPAAKDWNDISADMTLEKGIIDSHNQYIAETRQFSSGANFSSIADDNNSALSTNYLGLVRPHYIPVRKTATQVSDFDEKIFKRNKHMYFKTD